MCLGYFQTAFFRRSAWAPIGGGPKRIYAVGARVDEVPVPQAESDLLKTGRGSLSVPSKRKQRTKNYRQLPFGAVPGYAPLSYDRNDPATIDLAYKGRLMRPVPQPDLVRLRQFKNFVKNETEKLPRVKAMTFEEWIESEKSYNEERKDQLRQAYSELNGGFPTRKQAQHVDSFVKLESYPEWKFPRMINSRCDYFKAWAGRFIKPIEEIVYDTDFDGIRFIKHVPVPDRPAKIFILVKANMKSAESDFKAFECSFDPLVMDAGEIPLFEHCLADYPEECQFICDTDRGWNCMRARGGARAKVKGRRMSGDLWTSLGNGWTNAMVFKFICWRRGIKVKGYVEGDDGLYVLSELPPASDFEELGFKCELSEVRGPNEAHFCGMVLAQPGEAIKDPRRLFENFGWTHSFIHAGDRIMGELLRGKALCGCYETGQSPIAGVLYREALKRTRKYSPRFERDGYHEECPLREESEVKPFAPSVATRELFALKFGVSVQTQLEVENAIIQGDMAKIATLLPPTPQLALYSERYVEVG